MYRASFLIIWIEFQISFCYIIIAIIVTEQLYELMFYFRASSYFRTGRTLDYTRPTESSRSAGNPSSYSAQPSAASTGNSNTVRYGTSQKALTVH